MLQVVPHQGKKLSAFCNGDTVPILAVRPKGLENRNPWDLRSFPGLAALCSGALLNWLIVFVYIQLHPGGRDEIVTWWHQEGYSIDADLRM